MKQIQKTSTFEGVGNCWRQYHDRAGGWEERRLGEQDARQMESETLSEVYNRWENVPSAVILKRLHIYELKVEGHYWITIGETANDITYLTKLKASKDLTHVYSNRCYRIYRN
jgi:hypothetical protein